MPNLPGRLGTLTARDVMSERLVVLRETDTIQHAAGLFRDLHISGAPVVDPSGVPIGLLSVTDIVPAVASRVRETIAARGPQTREAEWQEILQILEGTGGPAAGAQEFVGTWMSRRLVSVREESPLVEVARLMCRGHWHRVTVVDALGQLCGIVSTMDVLAALVATADEGAAAGS